MTRRILVPTFFLLAAAALTLAGIPFTAGPTAALADSATHVNSPFTFTGTDPCTGEVIVVTGEFQETIRTSANGNGLHISDHVVAKGTAVVQSTGDEYTFNEVINVVDNNRAGCGLAETHTDRLLLNAPGGAPNFFVLTTLHITQDSECEFTTWQDNFKIGCLGRPGAQ